MLESTYLTLGFLQRTNTDSAQWGLAALAMGVLGQRLNEIKIAESYDVDHRKTRKKRISTPSEFSSKGIIKQQKISKENIRRKRIAHNPYCPDLKPKVGHVYEEEHQESGAEYEPTSDEDDDEDYEPEPSDVWRDDADIGLNNSVAQMAGARRRGGGLDP